MPKADNREAAEIVEDWLRIKQTEKWAPEERRAFTQRTARERFLEMIRAYGAFEEDD